MSSEAVAASAAWAGRGYAHLVLPTPYLGDVEVRLADEAVCVTDGWVPVEQQLSRPALVRRWQRPGGGLLVLVVLGWYPLLATLGAVGRVGGPGRRALDRVAAAAVTAGGRPVTDQELPGCVDAVRDRWHDAVAAQRTLEEHQPFVDFRRCQMCAAWSLLLAPHCRGCGHRFTPAEDVERDNRHRAARDVVARCTATLAALGSGEGLLPDWPSPPPGRAPSPLPALPGRVVA